MLVLDWKLVGSEWDLVHFHEWLNKHQFVLGGNWDYRQGSYDRRLDGEKQMVWLRIPFAVIHGELDSSAPQPGTRIRVQQPFVLHHIYNKGNDDTAQLATLGALVNQFQTPIDPDAPVPDAYEQIALELLTHLERDKP